MDRRRLTKDGSLG